jgi:epoxyqueuosine reductase
MSTHKDQLTNQIKQLAKSIGFTGCGIAPARALEEDAIRLKQWLASGFHASMKYMENHFEKRTNPSKLVPGAKSVIVLLLNYYPEKILSPESYQLAKYAYGKDYHHVIKDKLKDLKLAIDETIKPTSGRFFVDSAPVLERSLAALAGLGWIGRNTNLISPKFGSFVFIAELITDLELSFDKPIPDYCGGCTKCIQACPTSAIRNDRRIDSNKCISYWTIEHKGPIKPEMKGSFRNWIFGCDICQDVCPWNRRVIPTATEDLRPTPDLIQMTRDNWHSLSHEQYLKLFRNSAIKRAKYDGLIRNVEFAKGTRDEFRPGPL